MGFSIPRVSSTALVLVLLASQQATEARVCDDGFHEVDPEFDFTCAATGYVLAPEAGLYRNARSFAAVRHGSLPLTVDPTTLGCIQQGVANLTTGSQFWTGIARVNTDQYFDANGYAWPGAALQANATFFPWAPGFPTTNNNLLPLGYSADGLFEVPTWGVFVSNTVRTVVEYPIGACVPDVVEPVPVDATCDAGFEPATYDFQCGDKIYKLSAAEQNPMHYGTARGVAVRNNGRLPEALNATEQFCIQNHVQNLTGAAGYWHGLARTSPTEYYFTGKKEFPGVSVPLDELNDVFWEIGNPLTAPNFLPAFFGTSGLSQIPTWGVFLQASIYTVVEYDAGACVPEPAPAVPVVPSCGAGMEPAAFDFQCADKVYKVAADPALVHYTAARSYAVEHHGHLPHTVNASALFCIMDHLTNMSASNAGFWSGVAQMSPGDFKNGGGRAFPGDSVEDVSPIFWGVNNPVGLPNFIPYIAGVQGFGAVANWGVFAQAGIRTLVEFDAGECVPAPAPLAPVAPSCDATSMAPEYDFQCGDKIYKVGPLNSNKLVNARQFAVQNHGSLPQTNDTAQLFCIENYLKNATGRTSLAFWHSLGRTSPTAFFQTGGASWPGPPADVDVDALFWQVNAPSNAPSNYLPLAFGGGFAEISDWGVFAQPWMYTVVEYDVDACIPNGVPAALPYCPPNQPPKPEVDFNCGTTGYKLLSEQPQNWDAAYAGAVAANGTLPVDLDADSLLCIAQSIKNLTAAQPKQFWVGLRRGFQGGNQWAYEAPGSPLDGQSPLVDGVYWATNNPWPLNPPCGAYSPFGLFNGNCATVNADFVSLVAYADTACQADPCVSVEEVGGVSLKDGAVFNAGGAAGVSLWLNEEENNDKNWATCADDIVVSGTKLLDTIRALQAEVQQLQQWKASITGSL